MNSQLYLAEELEILCKMRKRGERGKAMQRLLGWRSAKELAGRYIKMRAFTEGGKYRTTGNRLKGCRD